MANQPSLIPSAWAANNSTTETIPATTTESGKASWDQGFPVETSLPLSEGGIPPKYGDFNGILNVFSQFCLFAQAGGQFTWSSTLSYSVGSIVVGSDGSIYRAVQATTNVNPVGDTSGKWERIVSQSDIAALEADIQTAMTNAENAVANASAAQSAVSTLDANVVKLSGDQTIAGTKTFSGEYPLKFTANDAKIVKELASAPSVTRNLQIGMRNTSTEVNSIVAGINTWWSAGNTGVNLNNKNPNDSFASTAVTFRSWSSATMYFMPNDCEVYLGRNATGYKWKQLIADTATISTSDERLKSSIDAIPDAVLDAWGDVDWRQFQFKDAIAEKGKDKARLHTGVIAQRVDSVFKAHGLDASRYGLWCVDHWDAQAEELDDEGNVVTLAHDAEDAYAIRYEEALCMEAAYQRRRADRAEARISALERRLDEMEAVLASLMSPVEVEAEDYPYVAQEQDAEQEGEE